MAAAQTNDPAARGGNRIAAYNLAPALTTQMLSQADKNKDNKLSRDEFMSLAETWFDVLDPDGTSHVSQDEFIERFATILPPTFSPRSEGVPGGGRGGFMAARLVGLFIAFDDDKDGTLTRTELKQTMTKWFQQWDAAGTGSLDRDKLVAGLVAVLPRTNMGGATGAEAQTPIPGLPKPPPSPVLPPQASIKTVQLARGFKMELTASEPMIEDPIAISFDENGRMFVLEMRGFMTDMNRTGEREPTGRISLLTDANRDGRFKKSSLFVDKLILPRAVLAIHGGILYVSDYRLWFARDSDGDGRADLTELIDPAYGLGNVEHGPNGLMRAMDNWIYNAESPFRYRFFGNVLVKQRTEFRGQWGMTQDNYGRLFYDVNNSQLLGDVAPPNYMNRNPNHRTSAGINQVIATDQRVFTIRMNTAVNRGYLTNVLDSSGKLYVFSSSCSPVIYRGNNYPAEFLGNAFVCDPSANLIKRNLVFDQNLSLSSKFAYDNFEFLASSDERFRPVNANNGPDGALWVVDMYRGVIQYGLFMTSFLRRESLERGLDQGIHLGRIYRIISTRKSPAKFPRLAGENSAALMRQLSDPNGWTRDTAQRLLVERGDRSIAGDLARLAVRGSNPLGRIHALWTLEGLLVSLPNDLAAPPSTNSVRLLNIESNLVLEARGLTPEILQVCLKAAHDANPKVQVAAIRVAEVLTTSSPAQQSVVLENLNGLQKSANLEVVFQSALSAGNFAKPASLPLLVGIAGAHADQAIIRHAILSGLRDWELQFLQVLLADPQWQNQKPGHSTLLQNLADAVMNGRDPAKIETLLSFAATQKPAQSWRRKALVDGIATASAARSGQLIALRGAPASLETLARVDDPAVRDQAERIKKIFRWPGNGGTSDAGGASSTSPISNNTSLPGPGATSSTSPISENGSTFAKGKLLFEQICAGCHGLTGEGLTPLAPPLLKSNWVLGPPNRLVRIALDGASGPIHVNGIKYEPPQTLPDMPSLRQALDDEQLAAVLSYVRQGLENGAVEISSNQVADIRNATARRETPWTEDELLQIK